ncbi:MAG: Fur family transcriptional regulator [bacterium]
MNQIDDIETRLREEGYFITEPRQHVIDFLTNQQKAVTVDEIIDALEDHDIDRSSVYRTVNLFTELGIVDKVLFRDGINRVEITSEFGGSHHHHLICKHCDRVIEFEECGIDNLERIADIKHDFEVDSHYMEFYGECSECRDDGNSSGESSEVREESVLQD